MPEKYRIYYYISISGDNPIKDFIDSLAKKQQVKILRILQYISTYSLYAVLPHIKKLTGSPLWEIRILGKDNIRIIYAVPLRNTILLLHGFVKKKQKTPTGELTIALRRHADWIKRHH